MWDLIASLWPWLLAGWITGRVLAWSQPADSLPGLPILGNVIALGRRGADLLCRAKRKFGDVFTLNLCGKGMTFLQDPALMHAFFSYPDSQITFRPIVEQITQRVYGMPSKEFFPKLSALVQDVRHVLVPGELGVHAAKLADCAMPLMKSLFIPGQQVELFEAMATIAFRSSVETLFGADILFTCAPGGAEELQRVFFEFDSSVELAASPVPHWLQPKFRRSRALMLRWLEQASNRPAFASTFAGQLVARSGLRHELVPSLLLLLLWASQTNVVPASFWAIAFLLLPENRAHLTAVQKELRQQLQGDHCGSGSSNSNTGASADGGHADADIKLLVQAATKLAMDRKSTISRCVAEAIRLRSTNVFVRVAAEDVELTASNGNKVHLPKGRVLAICPWEGHHNNTFFSEAWKYDPNRVPLTIGNGSAVVPGVAGLAFSGGPHRCPGRFLAEMEIGLLVQLLLWHLQLDLVPATWDPAKAPEGQADPSLQQTTGLPTAILQPLKATAAQLFGQQAAWGFGLFDEGLAGKDGQDGGERAGAAYVQGQPEWWHASGDAAGLLPKCNLQPLTGLKLPTEPCMVKVSSK